MFKCKQVLFSSPEGEDNVCRIKYPGKLQAFSRAKLNIRAPCKYEAVNLECQVGSLYIFIAEDCSMLVALLLWSV